MTSSLWRTPAHSNIQKNHDLRRYLHKNHSLRLAALVLVVLPFFAFAQTASAHRLPHKTPFGKMTLKQRLAFQVAARHHDTDVVRNFLNARRLLQALTTPTLDDPTVDQGPPPALPAPVLTPPAIVPVVVDPKCKALGVRAPPDACWHAAHKRLLAKLIGETRAKIKAAAEAKRRAAAIGLVPAWFRDVFMTCVHPKESSNWYLDSTYDGGFQFSPGTWTSVIDANHLDYPRYAYDASPEQQLYAAWLNSGHGSIDTIHHQWPVTSRACGL